MIRAIFALRRCKFVADEFILGRHDLWALRVFEARLFFFFQCVILIFEVIRPEGLGVSFFQFGLRVRSGIIEFTNVLLFLFFVLENAQIHIDPVSFEGGARKHGLEVDPFRVHERVLDMLFESQAVEFVKQPCNLLIHNDIKLKFNKFQGIWADARFWARKFMILRLQQSRIQIMKLGFKNIIFAMDPETLSDQEMKIEGKKAIEQLKQLFASSKWVPFSKDEPKWVMEADGRATTMTYSIVPNPLEEVHSFLTKDECLIRLNYLMKNISTVYECKTEPHLKVQRQVYYGYGPIADRQLILLNYSERQDDTIYIGFKSCDYPHKSQDKVVRGKVHVGGFILTPHNSNAIKATYISDLDLTGLLQSMVKDHICKNQGSVSHQIKFQLRAYKREQQKKEAQAQVPQLEQEQGIIEIID